MTEPRYLIPETVLQKVVDYLSTRPYSEVATLIAAVQQGIQEYPEPDKPIKENKA